MDRTELTVAHADTALDTLALVDHMRLSYSAFNSLDRTVSCTKSTTLTFVGDNFIFHKCLADMSLALVIIDMVDIFLTEEFES